MTVKQCIHKYREPKWAFICMCVKIKRKPIFVSFWQMHFRITITLSAPMHFWWSFLSLIMEKCHFIAKLLNVCGQEQFYNITWILSNEWVWIHAFICRNLYFFSRKLLKPMIRCSTEWYVKCTWQTILFMSGCCAMHIAQHIQIYYFWQQYNCMK